MGIPLFGSSSSYDSVNDSNSQCTCRNTAVNFPNPNPFKFVIIKHTEVGDFLVIKIKYPDCTNYEGMKILVFRGIGIQDLYRQNSIDPHFSDNKRYHSPVARFEPSEWGWKAAITACKHWNNKE